MAKKSPAIAFISFIMLLAFDSFPAEKNKSPYPDTKKIKVVEKIHGVEVIDNYRWLEDLKNLEVQAWIDKQNCLSQEALENLPQRKWAVERYSYFNQFYTMAFSEELNAGNHVFWQEKKEGDKNWSVWTRESNKTEKNREKGENKKKKKKEEETAAPARKLLDLGDYGTHAELWGIIPSPDGKYLVFVVSDKGKENESARIIDVASGCLLPDTLQGWRHSFIEWLPDSPGFYYTASPKKGEVPAGEEYAWGSVYFHKIGTPPAHDKKIFYHPTDKKHMHWVKISENKKYVFFYRGWYTSGNNEIFFIKLGSAESLKPLVTGFDARYQVEEFEDQLIIQTDWQASRGRVFLVDPGKPARENWKEFIAEAEEKLERVRAAAGYVLATYLSDGATRIKIFSNTGRYLRDIPMPSIGNGSAGGKWDAPGIRVVFSSYTVPSSLYTYDFKTDTLSFHKQIYPLKVDVSPYVTHRVFYPSKDGTRVSMFLLQRKDLVLDGNNPTLLHGYGGFNKSMRPVFYGKFIPWLEAGGIVAIPNLRGGGEYGREWYEGGIRRNKQNSFDDCIAAVEWLINNKYTNPQKLALQGTSNGGLMALAVAVQKPALFKAVWSNVPFADMIRYNKYGTAAIWINEYGNPDLPEDFKAILGYSPYHHVKEDTAYPAMLITAGENDVRCHPLHAMKMTARLQAVQKGDNPILLRVVRDTGHDADVTTPDYAIREAEAWAFLMSHLGMQAPTGENN